MVEELSNQEEGTEGEHYVDAVRTDQAWCPKAAEEVHESGLVAGAAGHAKDNEGMAPEFPGFWWDDATVPGNSHLHKLRRQLSEEYPMMDTPNDKDADEDASGE